VQAGTHASTLTEQSTSPYKPSSEEVQQSLGQYKILESIGKGGMGEVFRAYDTVCGRIVALKEIRSDLKQYQRLHRRFLHEARITSQLAHPAIIPIYAIHYHDEHLYYTMPYVKGDTLKQRIRRAREHRREGKKIEHEAEIPALSRVFLAVCQAIAYSHKHDVIHRDLKPENIIVGDYGEVLILDWGLGQRLSELPPLDANSDIETPASPAGLTQAGKIVGTLNYMSPERALGNPATKATDIYALGVILFQILTLRMPFSRSSFADYQENWEKERLPNPVEAAPYRDIPRILARAVKKALAPHSKDRYQSVEELIHDIENYTEGRSEWFQVARLDPNRKDDWEFQEHVFIAENIAITSRSDEAHWVHLMVSKASFPGNVKLEGRIKLDSDSHGIGFLLNVPESAERDTPYDGYCLWLGSDRNRSTCVLRSSQEVLNASDIFLKRGEWYHICLERVGNKLNFYLNQRLQLSFVSHLPIVGTHAGLIARDSAHEVKDLCCYVSSLSLTVDCLAVPNAFLASGDYDRARNEYLRIAEAFPGRTEGREALFRAGISFLEQARQTGGTGEQQELLDRAREAFEKLRQTPGAPLEYLGKALVYRAERETGEEVKCYEMAYRRYTKHPLLPAIREQVIYRMHETSRHNRSAAYALILLALRHIPDVAEGGYVRKLIRSLERHWEPLPFIEEDPATKSSYALLKHAVATRLAFWLARPYVILEIIDDIIQEKELHVITLGNALACLVELGCTELAVQKLDEIIDDCFDQDRSELEAMASLLRLTIDDEEDLRSKLAFLLRGTKPLSRARLRIAFHLLELAIDDEQYDEVRSHCADLFARVEDADDQLQLDIYRIYCELLSNHWDAAVQHMHRYPFEMLSQESSALHTLYGCWLRVKEGPELAKMHFSGVLETKFPRSWTLLSHYLNGKINVRGRWFRHAFLWERRQLYRQLILYYHCCEDEVKKEFFQRMEEQEYLNVKG
jgi:serine/threonine-protein kinase